MLTFELIIFLFLSLGVMKNNIESILAIDEIYKMECLENFSFGMNNL
jgi:hypothetical protein